MTAPECTGPGATHHLGCACHEERLDTEIERLRSALRQALVVMELTSETHSCALLPKAVSEARAALFVDARLSQVKP